MTKEENTKLTAFEYAGMEKYLLNKHLEMKEKIDSKVQFTSERLIVDVFVKIAINRLIAYKHHPSFRIDRVIQDLEQIKEKILIKQPTYKVSS